MLSDLDFYFSRKFEREIFDDLWNLLEKKV
jgi:hypothetical protein